jgi:hypothetical protein
MTTIRPVWAPVKTPNSLALTVLISITSPIDSRRSLGYRSLGGERLELPTFCV